MVFHSFRRSPKRLKGALAVLLSFEMSGAGLQAQAPALPDGGAVRSGSAQISTSGAVMQIDQASDRAIIDWRSFGIGAGGQVVFVQPSARSATLNRVTGEQVSVILGRLDANGQVLLVNPNGILFGGGSRINVGSLVATTSNLSDANFMAGRLVFDQPGRPGAGVLNAGALTAADGGLIALVAPHVRNDGVIVARLGHVLLGAADTFTVDLYGDALINLALSDAHAGQLRTLQGEPVASLITQAGRIETAGGRTVLMTARNAKNVLDNLINMSGTIKADAAVEQGGRILLLGEGGTVGVSGALSARGGTGGAIEVLGDRVHIASTARIDAGGAHGGGVVHVGGAFQGQGDTYRSTETTVAAGATIAVSAGDGGNGGEAVVWSDGRTTFAGAIEALGGAGGGDGGRMEVSGKGALEFLGQADASAAAGQAGTLLLDPAFLDIDAVQAGVITRVLRTGTSTTLAADVDITVNSAITGGDRAAGGGLTMTAGNNININDFVVTNNGAINLSAAQGAVNVAPGKAVFAGTAPITVTTAGSVRTSPLVTSGALSVASTAGSVRVDSFIDGHSGPVSLRAAGDVDIDEPIVNFAGGGLEVAAGSDINVNAQVDGRGGAAGGAVTMSAARNLLVNESIVTDNGAMTLAAATGAIDVAAGAALVAGTGDIALRARGDVTSGALSGGTVTMASAAGSVAVNGLIDSATGDARIDAAADVNINQPILNGQSGRTLAVTAGRDVHVNAAIDGRGGAAGGAVALTAGRNLAVNQWLATNGGAISLNAAGGTATVAADKGLVSGTGAISIRAAGDVAAGAVSGGSFAAASSGGSVRLNGLIDGSTGRVDVSAANDVQINQPVLSPRSGQSMTVTAGRDIAVNAPIDGRNGAAGGGVTLTAARDVAVNSAVVTRDGAIGITATGGSARMAPGTALVSGGAPIAMTAGGDVVTRGISGGTFAATSTGGSVNVDGVIDGGTGRVDLRARGDVNLNQPVLNIASGAPFTATAGGNVNVNAPIDGSAAARSGAATLSAGQNVNVNAPILTRDGAISLAAVNGQVAVGPSAGLFGGAGAISMSALGNVTTGALSGGPMTIVSRNGSVAITGPVTGNGGAIAVGAATQVDVARAIVNPGTSSPVTITAGTSINLDAPIDGRTASGGQSSAVTLTAGQNVNLNSRVTTTNAPISLIATGGTVASGAGNGLFAGSGAISVQSGQTLSTGITSTTGSVTLVSTGGSVNVDTAIGGTGAVAISAANDVNVNRAIANTRPDAPLTVSAGRDIAVNAPIDGRDPALTGASGTTTLTAGRDIALNQNIASRDSAIALTAQNGSIIAASGIGLFAGNGTISETSGQTLTPGITSTTGALNFRSTQGGVNINTAIGDTTGAVSIDAATTVNLNQAITNLKTGASLSVTAGADINVAAQVDGRGGVAGGAVTMTAGNNLNVAQAIATNNGAVALTATAGSVTVPTGVESAGVPMEWIVAAGNAPVSVTSGGSFSLNSPIDTTGSLAITSTKGNVTIAAPITDKTGAVTITAGNGLTLNHQVKSANKAIVLNAGAGGITVNTIMDFDQTLTSPVNSGSGNLTFNSVGNVAILESRGIATTGTLTIDTRGQILSGSIGDASTTLPGRPQSVILNADGGIASFSTGFANSIAATSSGGSITMTVSGPDKLRITTGTAGTTDCPTCDINLDSSKFDRSIGADVALNAGGSVNLSDASTTTLDVKARSGDANFSLLLANQVTVAAGRDVTFGAKTRAESLSATAGRDVALSDIMWIGDSSGADASGGPLTLTAGRNIVTTASSPIHVGNGQTLTLTAGQDVTLNVLETLGAVNITATNGNVTLNNDIGPHIVNLTAQPDFNPADLGVASLSISAPSSTAAITMQGARAEGNVTITTGGSLTAAKQITSVGGIVSITAGSQSIAAVPIGNQDQLGFGVGFVSPVASPGPKAPLPTAPGVASSGGPGLPALTEIPVAAADQVLGGAIRPGATRGTVGVPGAPGGAGAPGVARGATAAPGSPSGPPALTASGASSEPGDADPASALRDAEQDCGKASQQQNDTGLEAVEPAKASQSPDKKNASCAAAPAEAAPVTAPAAAPGATTTTGGAAADPSAPRIGGGMR